MDDSQILESFRPLELTDTGQAVEFPIKAYVDDCGAGSKISLARDE